MLLLLFLKSNYWVAQAKKLFQVVWPPDMDLKCKCQKKENMTTQVRIRPSKEGERPKSRLLCDYVHYTVLVLHHQYLSYLMTKKCTQFLSSIVNTCPISKQEMHIVLVPHHQILSYQRTKNSHIFCPPSSMLVLIKD
jgi:hypothetical protein